MNVSDFDVRKASLKDLREFIEKWHYSGTLKGVNHSHCFGLYRGSELIGAAVYGTTAMPNVWKKYSNSKSELLELRRLCCIDDTPKNTESFFIGKTLRWLKRNTEIKTILSYSDLEYGHTGIIYKASNFTFVGQTRKQRKIKCLDTGRLYQDRIIRNKYKGKVQRFAQILKIKLEVGDAEYIYTKPKNIYTYDLREKKGTNSGPP